MGSFDQGNENSPLLSFFRVLNPFPLRFRAKLSNVRKCYTSPSSRGLGHRPLTAATRVRIP